MISYFELFQLEVAVMIDLNLLELRYLIKLNEAGSNSEICLIINEGYSILLNDLTRIEHVIMLLSYEKKLSNNVSLNTSIITQESNLDTNLINKEYNLEEFKKNNQKLFQKYFEIYEAIENNDIEQNKIIYAKYKNNYTNILLNMQKAVKQKDLYILNSLFVELKFISNILIATKN